MWLLTLSELLDVGWLGTLGALLVLALLALLALAVPVWLVNRPRAVVPPEYRDEPGLLRDRRLAAHEQPATAPARSRRRRSHR